MNINKIGLSLLNCIRINNDVNKNIFLNKDIKDLREYNEKKHNKYLEDISFYISNYENKRNENTTIYEEYLNRRFGLYKQWLDNKNIDNLHKLVNFPRPELNDVPDIYTKQRIVSSLK